MLLLLLEPFSSSSDNDVNVCLLLFVCLFVVVVVCEGGPCRGHFHLQLRIVV